LKINAEGGKIRCPEERGDATADENSSLLTLDIVKLQQISLYKEREGCFWRTNEKGGRRIFLVACRGSRLWRNSGTGSEISYR